MKASSHAVLNGILLFLISAVANCTQAMSNNTTASDETAIAPNTTFTLRAPKVGRQRPLVAIIGENAGTETTDFVVPFGVLKESGAADVLTVSTGPGLVQLMPALQVRADRTAAEFDASNPAGADVVLVPAMHRPDDPVLIEWVRSQYQKGALVMSICEGAWVLGYAGLLDGKKATTHWYALDRIAKKFPTTVWVRNRRYVVDGRIMTTTGVTASIPASLALVEAIAGRQVARDTAQRLGVVDWDAKHDTSTFSMSIGQKILAGLNWIAVWRHETIDLPVDTDFDEISVALVADAWSRTYRSEAQATNANGQVHSRRGLLLEANAKSEPAHHAMAVQTYAPARAVDTALNAISERYGQSIAQFVAVQLEYPRPQN